MEFFAIPGGTVAENWDLKDCLAFCPLCSLERHLSELKRPHVGCYLQATCPGRAAFKTEINRWHSAKKR
ncbi:MAG: hypothetical protein AAGK05_19485, partial [Pseudomonadota bacterium]